tara:strand:- start:8825 stop:9247 length:423 start_codon:yes stop_codon:yes gene_type:complete
MPYPMLNKHSEKQYLELEKNYLNLYTFIQSCLSITEGEDLDSDSKKLIHFGALCMRINQAVEEYAGFTEEVRNVMFKGDSATTSSETEPLSEILIKVNKVEYGHIIEALEHFANMYPDSKVADEFQQVADDIKNLKRSEK